MSTDKEQRTLNVSFSKSGSGGLTTKLTIPMSFWKAIGVTPESRQVEVTLEGNEIIIKKDKNN